MTNRRLLTDEEHRALLGIPDNADGLARLFTFTRSDRELVAGRRKRKAAGMAQHVRGALSNERPYREQLLCMS